MANRIPNPGYESATLTGTWDADGGAVVSVDTVNFRSGTQSGKAVCAAGGSTAKGFIQNWDARADVVAGENLHLEVWVYSTVSHLFNLGFDQYTPSAPGATKSTSAFHGGTGLERLVFDATIDAGITKAQCFCRTGSAVAITFWLDDWLLDLVAGAGGAPVSYRRTINRDTIVESFDRDLDPASLPGVSAWTVNGPAGPVPILSRQILNGEGGLRHLVIVVGAVAAAGESWTLAYAKPATSPLQAAGTGDDVASYAAQFLTNISGGSPVTPFLEEASGATPTAPATFTTAGTGSSAQTQHVGPPTPYSGAHQLRFQIGTGPENKFSREVNTAPDYDEGTEVWWGGAVNLPPGYYADLKNESRMFDLNSYLFVTGGPEDHPTVYLGVWRDVTEDVWELTRHLLDPENEMPFDPDHDAPRIVGTWNMNEGVQNHLEVRSVLSRVDGLARNEVWLNGTMILSSTTHNYRSGFPYRSAQWGIGSTGEDQDPTPLTMYCDRLSLSPSRMGANSAPVGRSLAVNYGIRQLAGRSRTLAYSILEPAGGGGVLDPDWVEVMPGLEWSVEVAFATDPTAITPVWEPVTLRVVRASRMRGRQNELERDEISTLEITLRNRDRALDPEHTGSPYWPNVIPTRRIRVRFRLGGTTILPWFDGYTGKWPYEQTGPKHSDITIQCRDGFEPIQRAKVSGDFPEELASARVTRVLDLIGWPAARRQIFASQSRMMAELVDRADALQYLRDCAETEQGRIFMSTGGDVVFHDRHRKILASGTPAAIYGDDPAGGVEIPYRDVVRLPDDDKVRNEIIGQRPGGQIYIAHDQASENRHFLRSFTIGPKLTNDVEVADLVTYLLSIYKDAKTRFESMELSAVMDSRIPLRVLTDELGTRLTIRERPLGIGAMFEQQVHIEKVTDSIAQPKSGFEWIVNYELSPAATTGFWVLGVSALGIDTRLAY